MPHPRFAENKGSRHSPKSRKEEQEYGKGKENIVLCPTCGSVYWYKSWHHNLEDYKYLTEEKMVRFSLCPACSMAKDKVFEGQVLVEHIPASLRREVESFIYHIADRAYARDPMDRLLDMRPYGKDGLEIHTSENQLAKNIAKEIVRAHKHAKEEIRKSKEESVLRAWVRFEKQ